MHNGATLTWLGREAAGRGRREDGRVREKRGDGSRKSLKRALKVESEVSGV